MPQIKLIEHNGTEHLVEAARGITVMQAAVDNLVPGIVGDCGGACSCATCHAYVDPQWAGRLPPPGEDEQSMLEGVIDQQPNSRLTCQIVIDETLDGMVLRMPASQF